MQIDVPPTGPSRRRLLKAAAGLVTGVAVFGLGGGGRWLRGAEARDSEARDALSEQIAVRRPRAIRRGCAYLASQQTRNGQFGSDDKAVVALTALSVLALMSDGSTDGRGPYGDAVRRGLNFLIERITKRPPGVKWHEGYFYHPTDISSQMHGQGYATLALATALGTSTGKRYREIRAVLEKAVACIEQSQTQTGGFGYKPVGTGDHEGSVTVTVAQGLRAARDAGLLVNQNVIRKGLHYLKRSQKRDGSFRYSIHAERSSYALTAAALSSFFLYGQYTDDPNDQTIHRGLEYMMDAYQVVLSTERWYYYGHLYAAWTCWQKDGDEWGAGSRGYWARWHRRVYPDILRRQRSTDGAWNSEYDQFEFGDVLYTAFAVLTLAIPDEGLPIFQR